MGTPILHEATLESGKTETYRPPLASQGSSISTGIPQGHEPNTADSIISLSDQTNQTLPSPGARITFDEFLSLSEIAFEWGDSYDAKDWNRLRAILAPSLMVDYSEVNGHKWDDMAADEFVHIMSRVGFVGDPLVHTQHHIGASKWQKMSDHSVVGHHQLRAAHQRYTAPDLKFVENKGHGHAVVRLHYTKVGEEWKLAGLRPTVRWNEFEYDKLFRGF